MSNFRRIITRCSLIGFFLSGIACTGDACQQATATVVGGTMKSSKQMTKGIADGVEQGRKAGESLDGAMVVTTHAELKSAGTAEVYLIAAVNGGTQVDVAIENTSASPMRISDMEWIILDAEGFTRSTVKSSGERTIPPHAKDKVAVAVPIDPSEVSVVRLWGHDLAIRDAARPAPMPGVVDVGSD